MIAAYLFLNYNCILLCETSLYYPWGHSNLPFSECYLKVLLCVVFIAQISHNGIMKLDKLISVALQLENKIK